jgi:hypothetical protein
MRNAPTSSAPRRKIGYTFNWFYADDTNIAYFNSGQQPGSPGRRRPAAAAHGELRVEGLQPGRQHAQYTGLDRHPQIDQPGVP